MQAVQNKKALTSKVQTLKAGNNLKPAVTNPQKKHENVGKKEGKVEQKHLPKKLKPDFDKDELIRNVETSMGDPTSKIEFEKQILMRPNEVELWIKYITFSFETE